MRRPNVVEPSFHGPADRRSALDRAHRGDVEGAFGTIASHDTAPRLTMRRRLATLAAIAGPGLIVLVADNDAGGLSVYAQAGQDHGAGLVWVLLLLAPVLFVNQEMVARLGAVTGAGHARLIFERFGRWWGTFALADLLTLNLLIVATDFIVMALAFGVLGVSRYVALPVAVVFLFAVTAGGSYRAWERVMCALVVVNVLLVPLALLVHGGGAAFAAPLLPAAAPDEAFFVLALVGTVAAPWQLFLQQSLVVDKRVTARWLAYARLDTAAGTVAMVAGAAVVLVTCAVAFAGTPFAGHFTDVGAVARDLGATSGAPVGIIFAIVLINASLLGAAAVTLSSAYAIGDVRGLRHSLHRRLGDAPAFHATFVLTAAAGLGIALQPIVPTALIADVAQALAGVLLPSACVFLILLSNDPVVLGPRTNPRWLNVVAVLGVGVLVVLSAFLAVSTAFPHVEERVLGIALGGGAGTFFAAWAVVLVVEARRRRDPADRGWWERLTWTMPAIEALAPPSLTRGRALGLLLLRAYVLAAVGLTIVRAARIGS